VGVCCVLSAAALLAGCGPADAKTGGIDAASAGAVLGEPPSAGFQATVYETRLPTQRVTELDARALSAKAATPEDLRKALSAFGPTRCLYHAYEPISLAAESQVSIATRKPVVTSTRGMESGRSVNTVQYEQVGAMFKVSARPDKASADKVLQIQMSAELSAMDSGGVEVSQGIKAAIIRNVRLSYGGTVEIGRPFVALGVDQPSSDKDANSVAYVCRIVLTGRP
jgi:hypothetical protein